MTESCTPGSASADPTGRTGELAGRDAAGRTAFLEELGEREARCVASCGGDYLRTLYMTSTFLGGDFHAALYGLDRPAYELPRGELVARLQWIDRALMEALARVREDRLDWSTMDAFLRGVARCGNAPGRAEPTVRVLLCLVEFPPRPILEMPPPHALDGFDIEAGVLWDKFVHLHISLTRAIVRRVLHR